MIGINCECGHEKTQHDKKNGCMNRSKSNHDYRDNLGYCICTEFYKAKSNRP